MSIARKTSRLVGLDMVAKVAAGTAAGSIAVEGVKGCDPTVHPNATDLEPPFSHVRIPGDVSCVELQDDNEPQDVRSINAPVIFKVWCPTDAKLDWAQYNDLHKELSVLNRPIAFEIVGNGAGEWIQIVTDETDVLPLKTAMKSEFPDIALESLADDCLATWLGRETLTLEITDFFPAPPYCHTLTMHDGIGGSPLLPIYTVLSELSAGEFGFYRVLCVPTAPKHDWYGNINVLTDMRYRGTNEDFYNPSIPHAYHQLPSLYLPMISQREENKAHLDRPFFAIAVMMGALSPDAQRPASILRAMRTAISNFLYGAKALTFQNKAAYLEVLKSEKALRDMIVRRVTHRPGMILNSVELSGLFHFPPGSMQESKDAVLHRLKGREVPECLRSGRLLVGHNHHLGGNTPVYVPEGLVNEHIYLIGRSGSGKSLALEHQILQEIMQGRGVALIEPHGDLTLAVMKRIPREHVHRVVFLDFLDDEYTPCINPFDADPRDDLGRLADELTAAFHNVVESWGPRMENILRQTCYVLLHIPGSTFADIGLLLSRTSDGDRLRARIPEFVDNVDALRFWAQSFPRYTSEALDPVINKISKLMLNRRIAAAFSQRRGKVFWRAIMDEGKILLVRLSGLGTGNTDFLGSLMIGDVKEAACSRSDIPPKERRSFSLYIDEFHRFSTTGIESLLVETRKYECSVRLAHQESGQIDYATRRAVGTADTLMAFAVDTEDARHLVKEFRKEIKEEDLLNLRVGEAYARINNEIVDLTTLPPLPAPKEDMTQDIIEHSRRHYYAKRSDACPGLPQILEPSDKPRLFETFQPQSPKT